MVTYQLGDGSGHLAGTLQDSLPASSGGFRTLDKRASCSFLAHHLVMWDWSDGCHVDLLVLVTGPDTWQELLSASLYDGYSMDICLGVVPALLSFFTGPLSPTIFFRRSISSSLWRKSVSQWCGTGP